MLHGWRIFSGLKGLAVLAGLTYSVGAAPLGLLVPAYFYPPAGWDGLNYAASRVPLLVIVNPGSGPGATVDPNYTAVIQNLHAAGGQALGYVYSSYAARDTNLIRTDITNFFKFYSVDGIFVDEMQNAAVPADYSYYAGLYAFIQARGTNLLVAGNPGTTTQEGYLAGADLLMTFENGTGYSNYEADAWVTNHLARQFCHVIYGVTNAASMTNCVQLATSRNAGWVFVTDDTNTANPYERLPVYWTNEVGLVRSLNQAQPATRWQSLNLSNRALVGQISGAPGAYEIQVSSNLLNWQRLTNLYGTNSLLNFQDPAGTNTGRRFYRTRQ